MRRNVVITGSLAVAGFVAVAPMAIRRAGLIINLTPSLPIGIYRRTQLHRLYDGETVEACPPAAKGNRAIRQAVKRGWLLRTPHSRCADGLVPFLKDVAATPGQIVTESQNGLSVDGRKLPHTAVKQKSTHGRPIDHYKFGRYKVTAGRVWLYDNHSPWAYDSRYWGPVTVSRVLFHIQPILTW